MIIMILFDEILLSDDNIYVNSLFRHSQRISTTSLNRIVRKNIRIKRILDSQADNTIRPITHIFNHNKENTDG